MDRSSKEKINKYIVELNNTINQLAVIDIYRPLHPTITEYTFCSYGTFTKIDHILGHKSTSTNLKDKENNH